MRVAVTGASGFIGKHVVATLRARGHATIGIVRHVRTMGRGAADEVIELELDDGLSVDRVIATAAPDVIVHLAWFADPATYLHATVENLASLGATLRLATAARAAACHRFVTAGTGLEALAAAGKLPSVPIYVRAKGTAHELVTMLDSPAFRVTCAHIFWLYGPGEDPRRVVPRVIRSLLRGEHIAVTHGRQIRPFLDVRDVADALVRLAETDTPTQVEICDHAELRLGDVLREIAAVVGRAELIGWDERPADPADDIDVIGDPAPLVALGWRPKRTLREGIVDAVEYWRSLGIP